MFTRLSYAQSRHFNILLCAGIAATTLVTAAPALAQATRPAKPGANAAAPGVAPVPRPVAGKTPNAALEYVKLRERLELDKPFVELFVKEFKSADDTPSEILSVALEEQQGLIRDLIAASKLSNYDMQIKYDQGFEVLLPHLGHLRQFARMLAADARRLIALGRVDEAMDRYTTCLRISRHVSEDRVLISSLVGMAITALANHQVELLAADGMLSDSARKEYLKAAKALVTDDPFGTRACLQMEKQLALNSIRPWVEGKGAEAGRELSKRLRALQMETEGLAELRTLTEEQVREQIDLLERYYSTLNNLWVAEDAGKRLKELEERLVKGEFGILVRHLAPALTKCHTTTVKTVKDLRGVIALVEGGAAAAPADEPAEEPAETPEE